jgi:hypothetical protein
MGHDALIGAAKRTRTLLFASFRSSLIAVGDSSPLVLAGMSALLTVSWGEG